MDTHTYADHKATSAILKIHKRYGGEEMSLFSVIKNYLPALREYDFATAHPESGMMAIALASDPEGARVLLRSRRFLGALDVRTIRIVITHFVKNIFFSPKTSPSQRAHYLQHFKQALYTSCIANATSRDKLNGLLELAENGDPQIRVSDNGLLARIKEAGRSRRKALEVLEPRPSISFIDALADFFANSTSMGNFSSSVEVMF
ncbi:MAG: hypothetical protein HYX48_00075 [Chlamydiales bacterium]|nr:hypothetical protein [Chlamydiales bacterium]